jgi:poly-gamma-glutamate synthesis protein (capsule biosynthesis protein)
LPDSVTIVAVGDLVPSRRLLGGSEADGNGFVRTVEFLRSADVTFGDLEMPLSLQGYPREKLIAFHAAPEIAPDLKEVGFDVLSLANNHSLDYGYEALFETMEGLDRLGIRHVGAGRLLAEAMAPVILEIRGQRIGFLAFTSLLPTGAAAAERRPGLAPIHVHVAYEVNPYFEMEEPGNPPVVKTWADPEDLAAFARAIDELRHKVDFLIVSAHWGFGAGEELAEYQRPLGHALIDAGADVIFGNHVHAVHGVEVYGGKAILYSPGNFIAQQPREGLSDFAVRLLDDMSTDGYAALLDLDTDGSYAVRITPTVTNEDGLPVFAAGEAFERIADRLVRLSAELGTSVTVDGGALVVDRLG